MDDFFFFFSSSDDDRSPRNYLDGTFGGGDADEPAVVIEPRYPLESGGAAVSERDVRETVVNPLFGVEDASSERSALYLPAEFAAP